MSQIEVQIIIGNRTFDVACQQGEEQYLLTAARMLDIEAQVLVEQIGRMPESRLLLMSGLMLADKTAGLEDKLRAAEDRLGEMAEELRELREQPAPAPEKVEVPVIPNSVSDTLAEMAARAEALAEAIEEKAAS
ncbi:cell division protein ZapA [Citreicella sp. SE45]|uniref:Cell division protein ZapA n=1 Tax=Salipiger thiooxidans TaxID=282683 RepID=A0A1G7GSZ4_9RHOB|nr:cell division protein ZapA [Salipiger thiooxidans]EEX14363.1 cell division protein ZapA [Citreicella sp. SE45]MAU45349.1 cell division protein ZapA [Salipiger sp.]SDE91262.1 cell division protein ZapA [Salipiger thiooxidans]|tara:strand:- start:99 stop:500 length:402 start_codon:yes stop_codon:yes gene_type:complete